MEALQAISTFRAEEASETALYSGDGMSLRTLRAKRQANPKYQRRLAGVLRFYNEVREGHRPLYEMKEMLAGERYLQVFNETLTPSDFSYLFGDIIDRQLMAQYNAVKPSWQAYCKRATVPDFRTVKRFPLDGLRAPMSVVAVDDNYPAGKVSDNAYSYAVQKYGRTIPLAWETLINDDLNAFQRLPELMSQSAVNTEEYVLTSLFVASGGFNTNFFSSTNKNIVNQACGAVNNNPAFSVSGLQDAMTVLMSQVDGEGAPIAIRGVTVVVPPHLSVMAQNIITNLATIRIGAGGDTTGNAQVAYSTPEWLRNLKVAENYYLPIINTTAGKSTWFVFADPIVGRPAIEAGFLRGHETPEIFRKMPNAQRLGGAVDPLDGSYENDSVGYKIRHVIGGGLMDPKGVVVSRGDGNA